MERGREVQTNHSKDIELDKKVAKVMGLKLPDYGYRSLDPVQSTVFSSPPAFSTDSRLVDYMISFAKENNIQLPKFTYDNILIANAIVEGVRK